MLPHPRALLSNRRIQWFIRFFLVGFGLILVIGVFYLPSGSQSIRSARIVEIVDTPDTQRVLINQAQAQTGNEASLGQRILTEQDARAGLRLTRSAGLRLGKNSAFTVGSACIRLESGKVLVAGTGGCIGSVIATNRGTLYVMERVGDRGEFKVLEGSIAVSSLVDPNDEPVVVRQGQKIIVRLTGELGSVGVISRSEFEAILAGELFRGFRVPLPNEDRLVASLQQLPPDSPTATTPRSPTNPQGGGRQPVANLTSRPTQSATNVLQTRPGAPFQAQPTRRFRPPLRRRPPRRQPAPRPSTRPPSLREPQRTPQPQPSWDDDMLDVPGQPAELEPYLRNPPPATADPSPPPRPPIQPPSPPTSRPPEPVDTNDLQRRIQQEVDNTRNDIERRIREDIRPNGDVPSPRPGSDRPSGQVTPRFDLQFPPVRPQQPRQQPSPQRDFQDSQGV